MRRLTPTRLVPTRLAQARLAATRLALSLGVWALAAVVASAQTNQEVNSAYQFNFSNPGARSLAMGGSLTGLADDATAALTNPSGLLLLGAPEVSVEVRRFGFSNLFVQGGNLGTATGIGADTHTGITLGETDDARSGPSFLSFTLPRARWAIAAYRHELANFETEIQTDGAFLQSASAIGGNIARLNPLHASLQLKVVNYGASAAFKVSEQVLVGGGLVLSQLDLSSRNERFCWTCLPVRFSAQGQPQLERPGELLGAPLATAENVQFVERQEGDGVKAAFNVGVTLMPTTHVGIGASYRRGAEFSVDLEGLRGPAVQVVPFQSGSIDAQRNTGTFKVPDVAAVGFVVRPPLGASSHVLRLAAEVRRVMYSDLVKNFIVTTDPSEVQASNFTVDDGTELRMGGEYLIPGQVTIALRGGTWLDPDHRIRYDGASGTRAALIFRAGDDEWHYTGGGGITYKSLQIDIGFDRSERVTTTAGSVIVRF
jgi:long-subunit fatty acid transport protein